MSLIIGHLTSTNVKLMSVFMHPATRVKWPLSGMEGINRDDGTVWKPLVLVIFLCYVTLPHFHHLFNKQTNCCNTAYLMEEQQKHKRSNDSADRERNRPDFMLCFVSVVCGQQASMRGSWLILLFCICSFYY